MATTEVVPAAAPERSAEINELATALAIAQGKITAAAKDAANPFFKSKYADLASIWDAIREPLSVNGLAVVQLPSAWGEQVTITTLLMHKSGQWLSSALMITAKEDTPQAIGSAITYARRYALQSVVGVAPEDDDGNDATKRPVNGQWANHPKAAPEPRRANGAAHTPPERATEPVAEAEPHLSTLDQVLATFGKLATIQKAFAQLKPQFLQLLDINHWDQICVEHRCDGVKTFPSIGVAKKCFTALWEAARKASEELAAKEADPPVEDAAEAGREYYASNDDVPF